MGGYLQGILDSVDKLRGHNAWSIGRGNLLQQRSTPDGWLINYENDDRGRRTKMVEHGAGESKTTVYHWDHRDRLRDVELPDGSMARYMYDVFGRRVKKEIVPPEWRDMKEVFTKAGELGDEKLTGGAAGAGGDGVCVGWRRDVRGAERCLGGPGAEKGKREAYAPTWTRVHVHAPGGLTPWLQQEGGEVFTVVCNHLGQPRELVDARGRVAWAAAHSAWGSVVEVVRDEGAAGAADGVESPWRLLGQYADAESGLCYTRYRYFDADTGRWLSRDPLGIAGGRDLLGFNGAPSVEVDAWGLACDNSHYETREEALNAAYDRAGIVRGAKADAAWDVGDDHMRRGHPGYLFSNSDGAHGRYMQFETEAGSRVIAEHLNDGQSHFHAGQPKIDATRSSVDFGWGGDTRRAERYAAIGDGHHLYYGE